MSLRTPPPPRFPTSASALTTLADQLIANYEAALDAITSAITPETATFSNVILPFAHADNAVLRRRAFHILTQVSADAELREAAIKADEKFAGVVAPEMWVLVDAVFKKHFEGNGTDEEHTLDKEDEHLLRRIHEDMVRSGFALPKTEKARFEEIQKKIQRLGAKFAENTRVLGNTGILFREEELDGVPADILDTMERGIGENEGKLYARFDTHQLQVKRFAVRPETRRAMWLGNYNTCKENKELFREVALLRYEAARMLGYQNHAAYVVGGRMARDTETVWALLNKLRKGLQPQGLKELERYKEEKKKDFEEKGEEWDGKVYTWDMNFYGMKMSARDSKVDREAVSEYFPLQATLERMMETMEHLFGLVFKRVKVEEDDVNRGFIWRADVQRFSVWNSEDEGSDFLGYLFLDVYFHEFKDAGCWCSSLVPGYLTPSKQHPSVALVCNFPRPTPTRPSLLVHRGALNLFHELGHGIHDLVSKTKYARFHGPSGTAIDFGETPSQVLENWLQTPSSLKRLSKHYCYLSDDYLRHWREKKAAATGQKAEDIPQPEEQMPDEMIEGLLDDKNRHRSLGELGQLCMSIWDFAVHDQPSREALENMNISEEYNRLHRNLFPAADPSDLGEGYEWAHPYCTWSSMVLGDYHAGYYSYSFSEIHSADIFNSFFKDDPMNAEQGRKYRHKLLEPGGSRPEMETLLAYLGRQPDPEPFLKSLGISPA